MQIFDTVSLSYSSTPKLFSKVGVFFLLVCSVLIFFMVRQFNIYLIAPFVLNDHSMSAAERIELGSVNGTVISYEMLMTLAIIVILTYAVIKQRLRSVVYSQQQYPIRGSKNSNTKRIQHTSSSSISSSSRSVTSANYSVADYLQIKPFNLLVTIKVLALCLLFLLFSQLLSYLLDKNPSEFLDVYYLSAHPKWLLIVAIVMVVPIYEELIFRGILWSAIAEQYQSKRGVVVASISTSFLFALIHLQYDLYGLVTIFLLALLLSYARVTSGSLLLPMLIHSMNNALAMCLYLQAL